MGDDVRVKWNKEILYGKYSGNHKAILYKVKFDDNTTCKLERSNLYLPGEKIPKRVEAKMVLIVLCPDPNAILYFYFP